MDVELLRERVLVQIESDVLVGVDWLRVGYDALHSECFDCIDVFDFPNEVLVADFLGVAAPGVPLAQQICQFLVADECEVIQYSDELLAGY